MRTLTQEDLAHLHLPWESRFTQQELADHLAECPGLALHIPGTGDYVIGDHWQGRPDIGVVLEVITSGHREVLVKELTEAMRLAGARLAVLSQDEEERALAFYKAHGWVKLEEVLVYRRPEAPAQAPNGNLSLVTLTPDRLPDLMALEEATFPWLWRYGSTFFQEAAITPNRRVLLAYENELLVGYLIVTLHGSFGHLDRLAVHPSHQSKGYGAILLCHGLREMAARGATTIGLSTQKDNYRSQHLYESFGFRRAGKYGIYGRWLA